MTLPVTDTTANGQSIEQQPGSISFVVTVTDRLDHAARNLAAIRSRLRDCDEVIVLTSVVPSKQDVPPDRWFAIITIDDATAFVLRAQIPAVCRNEWVVLLEDHAFIEPRTIDSIREAIAANPGIDLIPFLGKNLTSNSPWGYANFLFTFALVWAPIDRPPPFSVVPSAIVRRARLGGSTPLAEGVWELRLIPEIFSEGKIAYANDIFVDHFRPVEFISAIILSFRNARNGAALQRQLGDPFRKIIYEGWFCAGPRPRRLARALASRRHEVPAGSFRRIRVLGYAHLIGNVVGSFFGAGRSGHYL
jgi:hypothetical protein